MRDVTSFLLNGLRDYGTGSWEGGDPDCDHLQDNFDRGVLQTGTETSGPSKAAADMRRTPYKQTCGKCGARRVDRQIGLEETPDQWVDRLVAVFREVRRVLRDDGTLWLEIGDSYASRPDGSNGGWVAPSYEGQQKKRSQLERQAEYRLNGHKPKDLLGQPWLLAKALRDPFYTGQIKQEADRVWLAAMVDAEGCIAIHKRPAGTKSYSKFTKADGTERDYVRKTDSYQPKVEITNTSREIMDRVVSIVGGNCETKQEAGTHGRKQTIYRWTVTADKARDLLRELYPHLVGKQHEARLAYGCPSSGDGASEAHESLKNLHRGDAASIDFAAPETMWEAGWFLRSEIIWARQRPNPMPESVTDRPTKSHSTVFLLSKRPRYFYDADAIREAFTSDKTSTFRNGAAYLNQRGPQNNHTLDGSQGEAPRGPDGRRQTAVVGGDNSEQHRDGERWPNPSGANARSVWTIPTEPTPFAHFATWPQALVRRMILAGSPEGGVVLDPFAGSATTMLVARNHGRHAVGIELNEEYLKIAAKRLQQLSLLTGDVA